MSEALTLSQRLHAGLARMTGLFAGGSLNAQSGQGQSLPVNLGGYDFARQSSGSATRLQSVDQALVWVVVALLMWGMVMVYSASIAMPDNPRFSRYAQTHFLTRHVISMVFGCIMALLAFQIPTTTWEKVARPMFVLSLVLLALVLVWQWLLWQRHWLAAEESALKPVMQALCAPLGCDVNWPREPDAVLIEGSSFNENPEGGFILQLRLKNTQHHAVATPALELNLTDMQDQVVVRRVFTAQELAVRDHIPALRDVRATLNFELDEATAERVAGFRAFIFYP